MNSYKRPRLGGKETRLEIPLEPGVWFTLEELSILKKSILNVFLELSCMKLHPYTSENAVGHFLRSL